MIRQFLARFSRSIYQKRWYLLVAFILIGGSGVLAGPHLKAWYDLRTGRAEAALYHSEDALAHLEACLATWPNNIEAHFLASRACRRLSSFPEARDHLRECQRLEGTPSEATLLEWELLRASSGDLDQVQTDLVTYLENKPELIALVREALIQGCMGLYRFHQALQILEDWLSDDPENTQALYLRGSTKQQMGAVAPAAEDHQKALSLDPKRDDSRLQLARLWLKSGRYEEALTQLQYLHKRKPADSQLSVTLARCLMESNRRPEAQTLLETVLLENPAHGLALQMRGRLDLRDDKPAQAESWLRKAVQATPLDYNANWYLYDSLLKQGKSQEAEEMLPRVRKVQEIAEHVGDIRQRRMSSNPYDPALHCELAKALIELGIKDQAEHWLRTALNHDPRYGPAHAALADLLEARGESEKAAEHRREAKRISKSTSEDAKVSTPGSSK